MVIDNCLCKGDLGPLTCSDLRGLEDRHLGSEGNSNGQSHKKSSLNILTVSAALGQPMEVQPVEFWCVLSGVWWG